MFAYHEVATAVYKRAFVDNGNNPGFPNEATSEYQLPAWAGLVYLINIIFFLPLYLIVQYTIRQVFPVFAILEDENPPAYEPVSLNDDSASFAEDPANGAPKPPGAAIPVGGSHTVTSSLRSCHRILRANGGFKANFRGFFCLIAQGMFMWFLIGIFSASLGAAAVPFATLLASLSLVQFSAAWVHIVITPQSPLHFWRRLPPFKKTFDATWRAVVLYWAAGEFTRFMPVLVGKLMGLNINPNNIHGSSVAPAIVVFLVAILASIFVLIPAHVVLVRVQASLLPEDSETIIPFDRSFEGKVEPAVVGGSGFVSMKDAWATFSRSAWRRLVKLYVKIYLVSMALIVLTIVIVAPQVFWMMAASQKVHKVN